MNNKEVVELYEAEEWREISVPGYGGIYLVSSQGRFKSLPRVMKRKNGTLLTIRGKEQIPTRRSNGYLVIGLGGRQYLVHRLLALAFVPNPEGKPEVNHKDGNKWNNEVSNFEWVTHQENMTHAASMGLSRGVPQLGSNNAAAKLNENEVRVMRKRYAKEDITLSELARLFGVAQVTISDVTTRKTWKHI